MSRYHSRSLRLLRGVATLALLALPVLLADAIHAEDPLRDLAPDWSQDEQELLPAPQIQFRFLLFPAVVKTGVERTLTLCMVNRGGTNSLETAAGDHVALSLPVGPDDDDIADMVGGQNLQCGLGPPGWFCSVTLDPGEAIVTFEPAGAEVEVASGETVCFELEQLTISSVEGLVFGTMTQDIQPNAAMLPENTLLAVFKSEDGVVEHDDLAEVLADQHHVQTWDVSGDDIHTIFSGNVGIGTDTPEEKLHVVGDALFEGDVRATASFKAGSTTVYGDGFISFDPVDENLDIGDGALFIDTENKRIGINTTNPASRLHVRGSQIPRIQVTATDPSPDVRMFIDARSAPPEGQPNDPPINRGLTEP